jgi:hypothetical protein
MGELKSAWELAQERANRLGALSAEEKEEQERQRYYQVGQALAQRWLDGSQQVDIAAELNKHEQKGRDIIRKAVIQRLAEAIELTGAEDTNSAKKLIDAITSLKPESETEAEQISQLLQEYKLAEQKIRQELESDFRETLHRLRISGTAVDAINIETDPRWQLARQELLESFAPKLNDLKQALVA